jgi:hypothetical protein
LKGFGDNSPIGVSAVLKKKLVLIFVGVTAIFKGLRVVDCTCEDGLGLCTAMLSRTGRLASFNAGYGSGGRAKLTTGCSPADIDFVYGFG